MLFRLHTEVLSSSGWTSCPQAASLSADSSLREDRNATATVRWRQSDLDSGAEVSRVVSVVVVIVSNTLTELSRQPLLALLTQLEEKTMTNLTQRKV